MKRRSSDFVFQLIQAMTKSEKRQFKLYSGRLEANNTAKFVLLFDVLDKQREYDERQIIHHVGVKKQQLSNLKAHLYKQILISLRLNPAHQDTTQHLHEQLDYARILYSKGLYRQSLKILEKAKQLAIKRQRPTIAFQLVDLEKLIETQFVHKEVGSRTSKLINQSKSLSHTNDILARLSDLATELQSMMLESGYAKNNTAFSKLEAYYDERFPKLNYSELGFLEKISWLRVQISYNSLIQDFLGMYKYAKRWISLFDDHPLMVGEHPVYFLMGHQHFFDASFFLKQKTQFNERLIKLDQLVKKKVFSKDKNLVTLYFLCKTQAQLNLCFLDGSFSVGKRLIPEILYGIKQNKERLNPHQLMVLYYKLACLHFALEQYDACIDYLNRIIENKTLRVHQDLLCFSRVLSLIAHYESGRDYAIEAQIKSTYKFLLRMDELQQVQQEMIRFLRKLPDLYPTELKAALRTLHAQFLAFEQDPFERRAFLYLDFLSWLEAKIYDKSIATVIQEKAKPLVR